jgi:hypothetical protein
MAKEKIKKIDKFFGGMVRDDKSVITGAAYNIEELDIMGNADYVQAEQIFSNYALPATTEIYSFTADYADTVYGYGKSTSNNAVRIVSVVNGGSNNPGTFSTLSTSADTTNVCYPSSPVQYFKTTEASPHWLYYLTINGSTVTMKRQHVDGTGETSSDFASTTMTLTGLDGSYDMLSMRVIYGSLYITNGNFVAKVDKDGVFTNNSFTLAKDWEIADIVAVGNFGLILARNINRLINQSKGFWWDLTAATQADDQFSIPFGGPQWIVNHKETVKMMFAMNGTARFYQLSGAFQGAVPIEIPGIYLGNVADETSTIRISPPKCMSFKDNILYFGVYKTDKTGVYAMAQIDSNKPHALWLSKRFDTTSYALHTPLGLHIQGPNYYGAYSDNGTNENVICKSNNSPSRSTSGVYESIYIDDGEPLNNKDMKAVFISCKPLPVSSSISVYTAQNYGAYTQRFQADATSIITTGSVLGRFIAPETNAKVLQVKVVLVSNGANSPQLTQIGLHIITQEGPANK